MFQGDQRGQSHVIGVVLLLAVSAAGAGIVVTAGSDAVAQTESAVQLRSAENALAQFDTRAALAVLGERGPQTVALGRTRGGHYEMRPDAGWLRITHVNASGPGTDDEVVHNGTLGALVYQVDETEIAYQGGGVWRGSGDGSVMISPPELHYRGSTLTYSAIPVEGRGSASGSVTATVNPLATNVPVYPNASASYDDGRPYRNPVENGSIEVTVRSRYYEAWVSYFRSRTTGNVTGVFPSNNTAKVQLTAGGTYGDFQMPPHGDAIRMRGLDDQHSVNHFTFVLAPDEDSATFANLAWELEADSPAREFRVRLKSHQQVCPGSDIDVTVVYENSSGTEQVWKRTDGFSENSTAFSYNCTGGTPRLSVNLTGMAELTYESGPSSVRFSHDEHGEPETFAQGDRTSIDQLVNHYLALFDISVDLVVDDRGVTHGGGGGGNDNSNTASGSVAETASFGTLRYEQDGQIVTFLRLTENPSRIEFE